jgi:alginate O-acetyltransferase complex protein AlgI
MTFQSLDFAIFLPLVFLAYWFGTGGDKRRQNLVLLMASLVFYAWWDWRFIGLLAVTSLVNYLLAQAIEASTGKLRRSRLLWFSVGANLAVLFLFKYFNFFVRNFGKAFSVFGLSFPLKTIHIVLPLGISFLTFQALGYLIDVYRKRTPAVRDPLVFLGFMLFFPKLLAGPIERASSLVPQFERPRVFDPSMAIDGLRRILLGLFMKVVVSDNIGVYTGTLLDGNGFQHGSSPLMTALFRPIQVYADFAGYSEMAIGTACLFGFSLQRNFSFPFFATNISMLWQRWHMTLTNWFRDYVFMVLPARRSSRWIMVRNISVIYILSGFWHSASWRYLAWGIMNAVFVGIYLYFFHFPKRRWIRSPFFARISTYLLFACTFQALGGRGIQSLGTMLSGLFSGTLPVQPNYALDQGLLVTLFLTTLLFFMEWVSRNEAHGLAWMDRVRHKSVRWAVYVAMLMLVFMFNGDRQPFIYMRF